MRRTAVVATLVLLAGALLFLAHAGRASAAFAWTDTEILPHASTPGSWGASGIACPSTTQCTEVDPFGQEVTFDPQSPGTPTPRFLTLGGVWHVTCPSVDECVGTTYLRGTERTVTFDPDAEQLAPWTVTHGKAFQVMSLACPADDECVAFDFDGNVVTFDPARPGVERSMFVQTGSNGVADSGGVACSSAALCTAVGPDVEVTFNPATGAVLGRWSGSFGDPERSGSMTCPSSTLCVAPADAPPNGDGIVAFNPLTGTIVTPHAFDDRRFAVVNCPAATQCIGVGSSGEDVTFDPAGPAVTAVHEIGSSAYDPSPEISCPAVHQCTQLAAGGDTFTFDPTDPSGPVSASGFADNGELTDVSCPTASQCTALESLSSTQQITFDPADPAATAAGFQIDPADTSSPNAGAIVDVNALACPTAVLCIAGAELDVLSSGPSGGVTTTGLMVAFDPHRQSDPIVTRVPGFRPVAIACPAADQCTALSVDDAAVTFDPLDRGAPTPPQFGPGGYLSALSCPTVTQCTAVGTGAGAPGLEVTFDPRSPRHRRSAGIDYDQPAVIDCKYVCDLPAVLQSVSCPTTLECVASDAADRLVTFDPWDPRAPSVRRGHGGGLACPAVNECIAVSQTAVSELHPLSGERPSATWPAPLGMEGLSCPTADECVFGDRDGYVHVGTGLAGLPHAPPPSATATPVKGRSDRVDVECFAAPTASCATNVTLSVREAGHRGAHRVLVLARARTTILGGAGHAVTLRLDRRGVALLRRRHALTAFVTATVGRRSRTSTLRLREPRRQHHPARPRHRGAPPAGHR